MASCDNVLPLIEPGWIGVEIGVQWGISALAMLEHGVRFLYLVDPWVTYEGYGAPSPAADAVEEQNFRMCLERLAPYNDGRHFELLRGHSEHAAPLIPNNLDFVWIDGNHGYSWVKKDIQLYWPKISNGGLLCGHDYGNDPSFDVNRAVDEFAVGRNLLKLGDMCWAVQK